MPDNSQGAVFARLRYYFLCLVIIFAGQSLGLSGTLSAGTVQSVDLNVKSLFRGDFYPERQEKKNSYNEKFDFSLGFHISLPYLTRCYISFSGMEDFYENRIYLETINIDKKSGNILLSYNYDYLNIGRNSKNFNQDLSNPFHGIPVIDRLRFNGLKFFYTGSSINLGLELGGNNFNTSMIKAGIDFKQVFATPSIYYIYTGRNNSKNALSHSLGLENTITENKFELYSIVHFELMPSAVRIKKRNNLSTFTEMSFPITDQFAFLNSLRYTKLTGNNTNFYLVSDLRLQFGKITLIPGFSHYGERLLSHSTLKSVKNYHITPDWFVGIITGVCKPSIGRSYYTYGLQTSYQRTF